MAEQGFQLSPQQRRAWSLLRDNGQAGFRVQWAVRLEGELAPQELHRALESVVARHEILRTVYRPYPGLSHPLQVILQPEVGWSVLQPPGEGDGAVEADLQSLFEEAARQPCDVASGPALQATLVRLSGARHVLLLSLPALSADPVSMANLVRELAAACGNSRNGDSPAAPFQYADVSEVLNDLLTSEETAEGRSYWRSWDPASLDAVHLPFTRRLSPGKAFHPVSRELSLTPDLEERVSGAAAAAGVGIDDLLLAAWRTFLSRRTGASAVTLGVAFDGRTHEGLNEALGLFVRYLPLAVDLAPAASFAGIARQIAASRRELAVWQDYFSGPGEGRFFPFLFDFEDDPGRSTAADLLLSPWLCRAGMERYHLRLAAGRLHSRLSLAIHADPEAVPTALLERLTAGFQALLEEVAANADIAWDRLVALGAAETAELAAGFNRTEADLPTGRCIHELIAEQARRTPGRIAVAAADRELTHAGLDALAGRLARRLAGRGAGPEEKVALLAERSPEALVGLLGILQSGAAFLPLDPSHPAERWAALLADARPCLVLAHERLARRLPDLPCEILLLDGVLDPDPEAGTELEPVAAGPDHLAYVIYTSGSTGRPKGVMVPHRGLTNYLSWCVGAYPLGPESVVPAHSPLGFDLTLTSLLAPLLAGGCVWIEPEAEGIEALGSLLESGRSFDLVKLTPAHLDGLGHLPGAFAAAPRLGSLVLGGEALRGESLSRWREQAPSMRIFNEYGPTETVVGCCVYEVPAGVSAPGQVPIGQPVANAAAYLLDPGLVPVPQGVPGELYVGGQGVARGYLGDPGLTAERFVPDPFGGLPGRRLYRTGDTAILNQDGELVFLGRRDQQVKIRGFRIELGEVEAALLRQPAVAEAVVTAPVAEDGYRRLIGYVVPRPGATVQVPALRESLGRELPQSMIPSAFLVLSSLPLTANGKVDRVALPLPETGRDESYAAPRNAAEQILAALWAEFLRLERVGIHDNFFELGGDSILALQIVSRAQQAGLRLAPRLFFQHQTIAALAAAAESAARPVQEEAPVTGPVPLTPIQRRFFEQVSADPHHYNQSLLLALRQVCRPASWEAALRVLAAHHDAFHLLFTRSDGEEWRQESTGPERGIPFAWIDLSAIRPETRRGELERCAASLQRSLDLSAGPLARAVVFDAGPGGDSRLLLVIHHLITDVVSWHVLLQDLESLVLGCERGAAPELPAKTMSFQRWALWLAQEARSEETARELDYWTRAAWEEASLLLRDFDGENDESSAEVTSATLDEEETRQFLQQLPEALRMNAGQVLLAALASALSPWACGRALAVDVEGHGREDVGGRAMNLARTVGWFTMIHPVLFDLSQISSPADALRQVEGRMREVPRQGVGYGLLRFGAGEEAAARLRTLPAAEISFNYLGRVDAGAASSTLFGPAAEPVGPTRSPRQRRPHVLEVNAAIAGDRLRLTLTYSRNLHRRDSVELLAGDVLAALRDLLARATDLRSSSTAFPDLSLDPEQLGRLNVEFEV